MVLLAALAVAAPVWRGWWPLAVSGLPALALLAYGVWTGVAGVRDLGRNLTPLPAPKTGGTLVTTGIYARMRHPLYSSLMALGLAWALVWSSLPGLALAAALWLFLHAKARHEEARLSQIFAEYPGYSSRVPRFFPKWR